MSKVYTINGKIVKTWFRRGKARIPVFEDGSIGKNQKNKKAQDDYETKVYGSDVRKADKQMKEVFGENFKYDENPWENKRTPKERAREIDKINNKSIKNDNEDVISNKQFEQASKIDDKLERAVQMQVADDVGKTLNDDDIRFRAENYIRHNYNGDASTDEIYEKLKSAYKNNGIYESTPSSTEDYNKINEKTTFNFGKVDAYGTGRKLNEITVEAQIKDGVFTASGNVWNSKHTDIISGGQNLDELKGYLKGNKEFENVYNMWKKYHLNDMHAGTVKQEEALNKKFGGVNANKYEEQVDYLKSVGLYEDEGYKYGTGWLKRDIPEEDMKNIVDTIRRNNNDISPMSEYSDTTGTGLSDKQTKSLGKMSTAELRSLANEYGLKSNELSRKQLLAQLIAVFNK